MGEDQRWYHVGLLSRSGYRGVCGSVENFHTKTAAFYEFIDSVIKRVEGNYFASAKMQFINEMELMVGLIWILFHV